MYSCINEFTHVYQHVAKLSRHTRAAHAFTRPPSTHRSSLLLPPVSSSPVGGLRLPPGPRMHHLPCLCHVHMACTSFTGVSSPHLHAELTVISVSFTIYRPVGAAVSWQRERGCAQVRCARVSCMPHPPVASSVARVHPSWRTLLFSPTTLLCLSVSPTPLLLHQLPCPHMSLL